MEYYEDLVINQEILKNIQLCQAEFENCFFEKINLTQQNLKSSKFIDCQFNHCNLSNVSFSFSTLRQTKFLDCKIVGVNWSSLVGIQEIEFKDCVLDYNVFTGLNLKKIKILNSSVQNVDFSEANLEEAIMTRNNFNSTVFNQTNLTSSDFRDSKNYTIDTKLNRIKKAHFSFPDVIELLRCQGIKIEGI